MTKSISSLCGNLFQRSKVVVNSMQLQKTKKKLDKLTNSNYLKFFEVLNSPKMLLEIKLEIWRLVILQINNLKEIMNFLGKYPSLDQVIKNCIRLKNVIIDWPFPYIDTNKLDWIISFQDEENSSSMLKTDFMKILRSLVLNEIKLNSIIIGESICNNMVVPDQLSHNPVFQNYLLSCNEVKFESSNVNFLQVIDEKTNWLLNVKSLRITLQSFNTALLVKFKNLKQLTIITENLLEAGLVRIFFRINQLNLKLNLLKIEYDMLSWNSPDTIRSTFCKEINNFKENNRATKLEFIQCVSNSSSTFVFTSEIDFDTQFFIRFNSLLPYFIKMLLSLNISNYYDFERFSNLKTLLITNCPSYQEGPIVLKSTSIKTLLIERLQRQKIFNFYLNEMINLEYLEMASASIKSETFNKLPESLLSIGLQDCEVSGDVINLPKNLKSLIISGGLYARFKGFTNLRNSNVPTFGLQLTDFYRNYYSATYTKIIRDLLVVANSIYYENYCSSNGPPMYISITPLQKQTNHSFEFSITFSETQDSGSICYERSIYITVLTENGSKSYNEIIRQVVAACIEPFKVYDEGTIDDFKKINHRLNVNQIVNNLNNGALGINFKIIDVDIGFPYVV